MALYSLQHRDEREVGWKSKAFLLLVSLEHDTDRTPDTTRFHLFQYDTLLTSFATRRQAERAYRDVLAASGYQPPGVAQPNQDGLNPVERERLEPGWRTRR